LASYCPLTAAIRVPLMTSLMLFAGDCAASAGG